MHDLVCTLSAPQLGERAAQWRALFEGNVRTYSELPDGYAITLHSGAGVVTEIERLKALEAACCAWMNISVRVADGVEVTMTSSAPAQRR